MKQTRFALILGAVLMFSTFAVAQNDTIATPKPILVDKSTLSGIGLTRIELQDQPGRDFFQKNLYRGEDLSIYVVSSGSWLGQVNNFSIDEYVYMLNGKARVKAATGNDQFFHSGEHFFAPKSFTGEWEILAGENYHYELSVITTRRSDSVIFSKDLTHQSLDKDKLSGLGIHLDSTGRYSEILVKGDELTLSIHAENPQITDLKNAKEQVICLLSGQINIKTLGNEVEEFYSGDFIIIPKGCSGHWESKGHGMVKYISIEKTG